MWRINDKVLIMLCCIVKLGTSRYCTALCCTEEMLSVTVEMVSDLEATEEK